MIKKIILSIIIIIVAELLYPQYVLAINSKGNIAMTKEIILTEHAPKPIGTYSQAVKVGDMVFLSGQIPLDPKTMEMKTESIEMQIHQVFENLSAVAKAAGGSLQNIVRLTVYLKNMQDFPYVNSIMAEYIKEPYPARVAIGVAALPKNADVEIDAIMML